MPPNCLFIREQCYMPTKVNPCVPNDEGKIAFYNQGEAGDCVLIYQLKGINYLLWPPEGESGWLNTGDTVSGALITHFPTEEYPESETVTMTFHCGYRTGPDTMISTDYLPFDIYVQVKKFDWVTAAIVGGVVVGSIGMIYAITKMKPARKPKYA